MQPRPGSHSPETHSEVAESMICLPFCLSFKCMHQIPQVLRCLMRGPGHGACKVSMSTSEDDVTRL